MNVDNLNRVKTKMEFVKIASTKDLISDKMMGVKVDDKEILIANLAGKYYAIGNNCTHRGCKLSEGILKGSSVQCPCHGSTFDIKTGNVLKGPANKPENVFQVKVEGDKILVKA
jgi:nitrite reductase/ring-hydroxylating ferredoxin subunit